MREAAIMHRCMLALAEAGCVVFRANVGTFRTQDGRWVDTGLPSGFSDLFGFTPAPDLRPFFVEVKTATGRVSQAQSDFLEAMRARGAIAIVCRDPDDCVAQVLRFPHQ